MATGEDGQKEQARFQGVDIDAVNRKLGAVRAAAIKPDDLVRTPSGRTCICEGINGDGSRALRDVLSGEQFDMLPQHLHLVRAAPVRPWKGRTP